MSGFEVDPFVVRAASETWDDQSEQLRGGRKRLYDAEDAIAHLGPRVASAAHSYVTTWINRTTMLSDTAQRHADALAAAASTYAGVDQSTAGELGDLLPWSSSHGLPGDGSPGDDLGRSAGER